MPAKWCKKVLLYLHLLHLKRLVCVFVLCAARLGAICGREEGEGQGGA